MKNEFYFPNKFKKIGVFLFGLGVLLWTLVLTGILDESSFKISVISLFDSGSFLENRHQFINIIQNEISDEVIGILCLIGLIFIGFSKEKNEDEFVQKIRLNSLKWAVIVNYSLLLFAMIFIYGILFFNIMLYNMFTVLIIYIVRFKYLLFKFSRNEE